MSALLHVLGVACEHGREGVAAVGRRQVHAGIVLDVRLGEGHLHAVFRLHGQRQEHETLLVELRQRSYGVRVLERVVELALVVAVGSGLHERCRGGVVGVEMEVGSLVDDVESLFLRAHESVCHAVVVGAELHAPSAFQRERELVVVVAYAGGAVERGTDRGVYRLGLRPRHLGAGCADVSVGGLEGYGRECEHRVAVALYAVCQSSIGPDARRQ